MTGAYTDRECDLAARLYAELVGYDLADRLPLRCQGPWHQRQWCAVARLAITIAGEPPGEAPAAGTVGDGSLPAGLALPPIGIPAPPIGATAVRG